MPSFSLKTLGILFSIFRSSIYLSTVNMNIRYSSIMLYFMICFKGASGQGSGNQSNINALYPCNVSGETRLLVGSNNEHFPQVCTYINISTIETNYTNISGLYFISFCYNGNWGSLRNTEAFCLISGYVGLVDNPSSLAISNEGLPKYSNLNCTGSETDIQMCGGGSSLTTEQCDYVTALFCTRCVSYTDCLGDNNSLCNSEGMCECKECVNGICYAGGCLCDAEYEGDECAESICDPPCDNAGVCQSNAICTCPFPYSGVSCETTITCSPACTNSSECFVDMTQQAVYCCPGEVSGIMCLTTQSTATTLALMNTTLQPISNSTMLTTSPSTSMTVISNTILDPYIAFVISIVIPLLCCLVIILYLVIICVCVFAMVFMVRMKHKMNKTLESNYDNSFSPSPDERRPTIYSAINEKTMLDYGEAPDLPPARMDCEYVEMAYVEIPTEKKTSHYEIEDEILEAKTSENKIEITTVASSYPGESLEPISSPVDSPSRLLISNDTTGATKENETAYENIISDP